MATMFDNRTNDRPLSVFGVPTPVRIVDEKLPCGAPMSDPGGIETVHIVDADPAVGRSLTDLFTSAGLDTLAYSSLESYLADLQPDAVGCLVLDLQSWLSSPTHFEAHTRLGRSRLPFVIIANAPTVKVAVMAMKAGAVDFLEKPCGEPQLLQAIADALRLSRQRRSRETSLAAVLARFATLSRREQQVMALVCAGRMNKQVAWELGLSEITVKVHRGSGVRKMGARSLPDLVRMADAIAMAKGEAPTGSTLYSIKKQPVALLQGAPAPVSAAQGLY